MDSSTLRYNPGRQYQKPEGTPGGSEVETLMQSHRDLLSNLCDTHRQLERALLDQKKEIDSCRQRIQQLEAEKGEYLLEQLRPITSFDVSDERISNELNTLYRSLESWTHSLPEIQNPPSRATIRSSDSISAHQFLSDRSGPNSGLDLSYESQKHLESELVAAGISRIMLDQIFCPRLFGIASDERRIFTKLQQAVTRMKAGEDSENIQACQKELIRVWTQSPTYEKDREDECVRVMDILKSRLAGWGFPVYGLNDSFRCLEAQSLQPASQLATKIQCSYEKYYWGMDSKMPATVRKSMFAAFDMIDYRTHCEIPPAKVSGLPDDAVIGDYVMTIVVPLYRDNPGEDRYSVIVAKGRCVVKTSFQQSNPKISFKRMTHVEIKQEPEADLDDPINTIMEVDEGNRGPTGGVSMASK